MLSTVHVSLFKCFYFVCINRTHITIATTKSIERKQTTCTFKISDTKTCPKQKLKTITVHFQNTKNLLQGLESKVTKSQNNSFELQAFKDFKRIFKYSPVGFFCVQILSVIGDIYQSVVITFKLMKKF